MKRFSILALSVTLALAAMPICAQAQETPAQQRKKADAAVDRNIVLSSAETINKGDITINSYELFLLGLTYGITDDLQVSATTLLPIVEDTPFVLALSGKWQFFDNGKILVSLQPNFGFGTSDGDTVGAFGAGVIADFLLDDRGKYVLTLSESNLMMFASGNGDSFLTDGFAFNLGVGFSARVARIVKLMAEFTIPGAFNWDTGEFDMVSEGTMFGYGVRFFGETIGVDLSFLRPLHPDMDPGVFVMGIPYVTFSARF